MAEHDAQVLARGALDVPVPRWDFYAAPFRIELADELQALVRQFESRR